MLAVLDVALHVLDALLHVLQAHYFLGVLVAHIERVLLQVYPVRLHALAFVQNADVAEVAPTFLAEKLERHVVMHWTGQSYLLGPEALPCTVGWSPFKQREGTFVSVDFVRSRRL